MSRFKHLDVVKKQTRKPDGTIAFSFTGSVIASFISLDGIPCVVVQNAQSKEMYLDAESNFELVLNPISKKEPPSMVDPNRPVNPER